MQRWVPILETPQRHKTQYLERKKEKKIWVGEVRDTDAREQAQTCSGESSFWLNGRVFVFVLTRSLKAAAHIIDKLFISVLWLCYDNWRHHLRVGNFHFINAMAPLPPELGSTVVGWIKVQQNKMHCVFVYVVLGTQGISAEISKQYQKYNNISYNKKHSSVQEMCFHSWSAKCYWKSNFTIFCDW